jgi:hypothetical protein
LISSALIYIVVALVKESILIAYVYRKSHSDELKEGQMTEAFIAS